MPTHDTSTTANGTGGSLSWSHTVGSGSDRLLIVGVSIRKETDPRPTVTAVTYAGRPLSEASVRPNDGKTSSHLWYLLNPPVGAANVVVTASNSPTNIVGGASSWFGVKQSAPKGRNDNAGENPDPYVLLTIGTDDLAFSVVSSVASMTVDSPQTERWSGSNSFLHGRGGSIHTVGGSLQLAWTMGGTQKWTAAGAVFGPADDVLPAAVIVRGGGITVRPELWTANINNEFGEEITDLLIEGRVDMNVDAAISTSCVIKVRNPEEITPYVEYLAPRVRYEYADGREPEVRQLGLYSTKIPPGSFTTVRSEATFNGGDLTVVLAETVLTDTWNIPAGTNMRTAMIGLLAEAGITRHSLPETTVTFSAAYSFLSGTTVLDAVNEIATMLGWYRVSTDLEGFITTPGETQSLSEMEPILTITTDDIFSPDFAVNPSDLQIVNVVVAVNTNNAAAPLVSVVRNDDPNSPTSTVTLGREISPPGGAVQVAGDITQARLDMIARQILRNGRSYYRTGQLLTWPNPDALVPHRSVELDLTGGLEVFSGLWYIRTASLGMTTQTAMLRLELNQTKSYQGLAI